MSGHLTFRLNIQGTTGRTGDIGYTSPSPVFQLVSFARFTAYPIQGNMIWWEFWLCWQFSVFLHFSTSAGVYDLHIVCCTNTRVQGVFNKYGATQIRHVWWPLRPTLDIALHHVCIGFCWHFNCKPEATDTLLLCCHRGNLSWFVTQKDHAKENHG